MTEIIVNGKCPSYIKKEEIRAIVLATITVMAYHGHYLKRPQDGVKVCISQRSLGKNRLNPESENGGVAWRGLGMFKIKGGIRNKPSFTTVLIHESIHLCASWGDSDEFIVSTLTDRLKESVIEIAEELASNTYRRAACFAHTNKNMAYHKSEDEDCYNDEQWSNKKTTSGNKSIAA
tara:strand:- start:15975 stop:16505 length:531 start_codon:yes stop_codon:yes gene_type:complete